VWLYMGGGHGEKKVGAGMRDEMKKIIKIYID
jgi:hypothetical protein